jgi:hypothetical protein
MIRKLHPTQEADIGLLAKFLDDPEVGRKAARFFPSYQINPRQDAMTLLKACPAILVDPDNLVMVMFQALPMPWAWNAHVLTMPAGRRGLAMPFFDLALGWAFLVGGRQSIFGAAWHEDRAMQAFAHMAGMHSLVLTREGWAVDRLAYEEWALDSDWLYHTGLPLGDPGRQRYQVCLDGLDHLAAKFHVSDRGLAAQIRDAFGAVTAQQEV